MGLSKLPDGIVAVEENKSLELTTAQKRRLRRKKLKAARAGSLEIDSNIKKDLFDLNSCKYFGNNQQQVASEKQIYNCDIQYFNKTQNTISKKPNLINNLKSKNELLSLSTEVKPVWQELSLDKNLECTKKNDDNLITNKNNILQNKLHTLENTITNTEEKLECENLVLHKEHKSKPEDLNQKIISKDPCLIQSKKNDFVKLHINENQIPKLKEFSEIKNHIPACIDDTFIKEKITFESNSHCIELVNSNSQNQEDPILGKQEMGKLLDTPDSQEQKVGLPKQKLKKEDTTSISEPKSREDVKAAREAKKLAKQKAKKKNDTLCENTDVTTVVPKIDAKLTPAKENVAKINEVSLDSTKQYKNEEVPSDLKYNNNVISKNKKIAEEKVKNDLSEKLKENVKSETTNEKAEETGKNKAELRAQRRAKQEAQRAAKQAMQGSAKQAAEQKSTAPEANDKESIKSKEEKSPKSKAVEKSKIKKVQRVGAFQYLYVEKDKESMNNIPINSNLHPAVLKLGVQLATRVVTGSNARCIALLDAIKKMVRDYSLPARTEVGRGLQAALAAAAAHLHLASPSSPATAAAETNALKHFRRQLTQLPANVDEFDAKKQLQQEIDRYIREQIDMAGEAISLILRNKISPGDNVLTYGCSSLIEHVLCSAWAAGVTFRATVVGARGQRGPEMLRRLRARGVPATYVDISAISYVMSDVQKVLLGAGALLAHGAALGAAGTAQVALVARARNVPVLVACETHKFSERTHLDPLVCHDIGDPDELIDKTDENSPLKDWRSIPNLTLLNVTYDVTPPSLITAVVTELGILPCTSAPVVLRFKQSEYGM